MKSKIKKALETKYKNLGFGDTAFEGVATYLETSIKEESEIETAISGVEILLKSFQSDADKVRTEKSELAKKYAEMEAKIKALGGEEPKKKIVTPEDAPAWVIPIIEQSKANAEQLARLLGDKVAETRKSQLKKLVENLPEELQKPYLRTNVDSLKDDEFSALISEITPEVESLSVRVNANKAIFTPPASEISRIDKPSEEMLARKAQREAEAKAQNPTVRGITI